MELMPTTLGLLYEREATKFDLTPVVPFSWNADYTVCTLGDGGDVVFKGIVRGADSGPITYIGPSVEIVTDWLALKEWIYVIRHKGA